MSIPDRFEVPAEEEYMEVFDRIDYNKDHVLSVAELIKAVKEIWPDFDNRRAIVRAFRAADLNCDSFIGRNEFELFLYFLSEYTRMYHLFEAADTNDDHVLSRREFLDAAPLLEIEGAEDQFHVMDHTNRGYIYFDEFCVWMAMKRTKRRRSRGSCYRMSFSGSSLFLAGAISVEKEQTYITRAIVELKCCFELLGGEASDEEIESVAILIHDCMSTTQRIFHTLHRIFHIAEGADPVQTIAAFFHDTINFDVNEGLNPVVEDLLCDVVCTERRFRVSPTLNRENDPTTALVLSIFGVTPGQLLTPMGGLNKLLSALLMARSLKKILPMKAIAKAVVCIKATTFFRKHSDAHFSFQTLSSVRRLSKPLLDASSPTNEFSPEDAPILDPLYERLEKANTTFELGLSEKSLVKAIQRAADSSNRSFGVFASKDPVEFLTEIWSILPEIAPSLRSKRMYSYSLADYHQGVMALNDVVHKLSPSELFVSFRGVPAPAELKSFHNQATRNLELAKKYTDTRSVALGVCAAFAELTGGTGPFAFFMGDYSSRQHTSDHMGDYLPELVEGELVACDPVVYEIMKNGRNGDSVFDIEKAPVSAYLYGSLGDIGIQRARQYCGHPMQTKRARELLSLLPQDVCFSLGREIASIAVSRAESIEDLLNTLHPAEAS